MRERSDELLRIGAMRLHVVTGAPLGRVQDLDRSAAGFRSLGQLGPGILAVSMQVPESMRGRTLSLYFDLFNNQNALQSLGWISSVTVVPEPGTWTLLMTGILFLFGYTWHQYEKSR